MKRDRIHGRVGMGIKPGQEGRREEGKSCRADLLRVSGLLSELIDANQVLLHPEHGHEELAPLLARFELLSIVFVEVFLESTLILGELLEQPHLFLKTQAA